VSDAFDKLLSRYKGAKPKAAKPKAAKFSLADYWREVCEPNVDDLTPDTDLGSWLLREEEQGWGQSAVGRVGSRTDPPHEWTQHRPAALKMLKKHVTGNWNTR
jgi:hypothetical protein